MHTYNQVVRVLVLRLLMQICKVLYDDSEDLDLAFFEHKTLKNIVDILKQ